MLFQQCANLSCVCVCACVWRCDFEGYGIHIWWWPWRAVSCVWRQSVWIPLRSAHLWELQGKDAETHKKHSNNRLKLFISISHVPKYQTLLYPDVYMNSYIIICSLRYRPFILKTQVWMIKNSMCGACFRVSLRGRCRITRGTHVRKIKSVK